MPIKTIKREAQVLLNYKGLYFTGDENAPFTDDLQKAKLFHTFASLCSAKNENETLFEKGAKVERVIITS